MLQGKYYRFMIPDMGLWGVAKSALRKIASWTLSLVDALPPHYTAEGILDSKRVDDGGRHILMVGGAPILVDCPTYHILDVGERVRVRYTRGAHAISIDRFAGLDDSR